MAANTAVNGKLLLAVGNPIHVVQENSLIIGGYGQWLLTFLKQTVYEQYQPSNHRLPWLQSNAIIRFW